MEEPYAWKKMKAKELSKHGADMAVLGLKELNDDTDPGDHTHIHFAHCYKGQGGWEKILGRFEKHNALLYDLEFLKGEDGKRVAAFGYFAGYAGAASGLLAYIAKAQGKENDLQLTSYKSKELMQGDIIEKAKSTNNMKPLSEMKAIVIGASGQCGKGAVALLKHVGFQE